MKTSKTSSDHHRGDRRLAKRFFRNTRRRKFLQIDATLTETVLRMIRCGRLKGRIYSFDTSFPLMEEEISLGWWLRK